MSEQAEIYSTIMADVISERMGVALALADICDVLKAQNHIIEEIRMKQLELHSICCSKTQGWRVV